MSPEAGTAPGLLDVNVLVALTNRDHVHHARAHEWFGTAEQWLTTPITEAAFVRLMLNPAVTGTARPPAEVLGMLSALRRQPGHRHLPDDATLAEPVIDLAGLQGHRQVTDLHLVDLAARHDATLVTFDVRIRRALLPADRGYCTVIG